MRLRARVRGGRARAATPSAASARQQDHRPRIEVEADRLVDAGLGTIAGTCKRAAYLGSRNEYVVSCPWGELLVFDDDARALRARDAAVGLDFDPSAVILIKR